MYQETLLWGFTQNTSLTSETLAEVFINLCLPNAFAISFVSSLWRVLPLEGWFNWRGTHSFTMLESKVNHLAFSPFESHFCSQTSQAMVLNLFTNTFFLLLIKNYIASQTSFFLSTEPRRTSPSAPSKPFGIPLELFAEKLFILELTMIIFLLYNLGFPVTSILDTLLFINWICSLTVSYKHITLATRIPTFLIPSYPCQTMLLTTTWTSNGHVFLLLYFKIQFLFMGVRRSMHAMESIRRTEGSLWETVLSLYHVDTTDKT